MAKPRPSDTTAGMAILGLLVQQPDTIAGVVLRLEEQYPSAGWHRNIVHNTLPRLEEDGFVRRTERGASPSWHWCEATLGGEQEFARWLGESAAEPPPIRDALMAKLKYVEGPDQLAVMVRDMLERERLSRRELDAAVARYRQAHAQGLLTPANAGDLSARVRAGWMTLEVKELQGRVKSLQAIREDLEDPLGRRDTLEDG